MITARLLDTYIKFLDMNIGETALTAPTVLTGMEIQHSTGCTGCLITPVQGDGPSQRDGHKIKCVSIFIQGYIAFPEATGDRVRKMPKYSIALVQDSQTNGVSINSEDIYQNYIVTARGNLCWKRSMSNTSRFKGSRRLIGSA